MVSSQENGLYKNTLEGDVGAQQAISSTDEDIFIFFSISKYWLLWYANSGVPLMIKKVLYKRKDVLDNGEIISSICFGLD